MPGTTTDGAPFPLATEAIADGAQAIENLAQWVDDLYVQDLLVNRPAFGTPGRIFHATNTGEVFLDRGTSWLAWNEGAQGTAASRPGSAPRNGMTYYATDTGDLSTWYNGAWRVQSTARAELASAAVSYGTGYFILGALTETVSGMFLKVAVIPSGDRIVAVVAGLYRFTALVTTASGGGAKLSARKTDVGGTETDYLGTWDEPSVASCGGIVRLAAGEGVLFDRNGGTGISLMKSLVVERVGP